MARRKGQLKLIDPASEAAPRRRNRINLFELAYQRIEELLVNCTLKPGRYLTMQDLQDLTGFGRTPVHHAVNRLAADTLINIRPRHGLQIAPIGSGTRVPHPISGSFEQRQKGALRIPIAPQVIDFGQPDAG